MKTMIFSLITGIAANNALPQTVRDIQAPTPTSAYLQDSRGTIVRGAYGLCWRTGYWKLEDAMPGCDGALMPPVTKPVAPPVTVTPPPATEIKNEIKK